MRVFFVALNGPLVAASRTRVFDYLPFLRAQGVGVDVVVVIPDRLSAWVDSGGRLRRLAYYLMVLWRSFRTGLQSVRAASRYDVVFIQRAFFPSPVAWLLRFCRCKVVFDFDDAIFTTEAPEADWTARLRTWHHRQALPRMLRAAHHAIVENPYTGAYAKQHGVEVSIITGPIDTERYCPGMREARLEVVLGWIGTRTSVSYLELIRGPLAELGRRYAHLRLCLIGPGGFEVEGVQTVWRNWSLETEVADLRRFDIGLMPVPDDAWTRGKGGYKILQYFAMGLPVVASPVGINREIVEDGVNGFLAAGDAEWVDRLERLILAPQLCRQMGEAGCRKMEACYSLHRSSRRLLHILESVAAG